MLSLLVVLFEVHHKLLVREVIDVHNELVIVMLLPLNVLTGLTELLLIILVDVVDRATSNYQGPRIVLIQSIDESTLRRIQSCD